MLESQPPPPEASVPVDSVTVEPTVEVTSPTSRGLSPKKSALRKDSSIPTQRSVIFSDTLQEVLEIRPNRDMELLPPHILNEEGDYSVDGPAASLPPEAGGLYCEKGCGCVAQ
mmetsp:Transcript_142620/g.443596  ORF Transcript_142620/g.443596 Transcript_142620/m.443596 type:complete len:113 (+) Transcript_142620:139-477(+)